MRQKIAVLSREGVCELIKKLDEEIIIPVAQDESKASYFSQINTKEVMLDFSKPVEEISAHIRAFHPWYRCYFGYNKQFFIPNPYELEIFENSSDIAIAGTIVEKSHKDNSITVLCGDNKLLKMSGLKLYGFLNRFFTTFYIKHFVKNFQKIH